MTPVTRVVIVGGGTAGWLTAGILAATHSQPDLNQLKLIVTVIESETISPIGVGEGTWPTMRKTLAKIGISENDLIKHASATFKQASKFVNWHTTPSHNSYYHPFSAPQGSASIDITPYWLLSKSPQQYAHDVCFQPTLCDQGLAPKLDANSNLGFCANYGYHLDASQFVTLLRNHCTSSLGVCHVVDDVVNVATDAEGITHINTKMNRKIEGDIFVDCSGFNALLIDKTLDVPLVDASSILFSDTALVCQLPYHDKHQAIACHTLSTAQPAGWIWDIGLQQRRGTGYVYASDFQSDDDAVTTFTRYLQSTSPNTPLPDTSFRKIKYKTGYRERFWEKNCVSIGLSSGFLEPLEASSLMLIEQSAIQLAEQLPSYKEIMPLAAKRFNASLNYKWQNTIQFLKLHYVLSNRSEEFWKENSEPASIPGELQSLLTEWRYRPIVNSDFVHTDEVFSAQSYRYILYGMNARTELNQHARMLHQCELAQKQFHLNKLLITQLLERLPSHRGLIDTFLSEQPQ